MLMLVNVSTVFAESTSEQSYEAIVRVNPLYADVITEEQLEKAKTSKIQLMLDEPVYCNSYNEAGKVLREAMKNQENKVSVYVKSKDPVFSNITDGIFETALEHTGNPTEGDYIKWQYGGYTSQCSRKMVGDTYYYTIDYSITYYTTPEQEIQLTKQLQQIVNTLSLEEKKSDYEKVKAIYDYICKNVTYDYTNLPNNKYTLKYTAYAAVINRTAVCQGYSVLFYRMALTAGVDARFISGTGNGGPHGWNIVRVGNLYYNIDSTWDAGISRYCYFLNCPDSFKDHIRLNHYDRKEFHSKYPMASSNYRSCNQHSYLKVVTEQATCKEEGIATYTCSHGDSVYMEIISNKDISHEYDDGVVMKRATCEEEGIKTYTCKGCKKTKAEPLSKTGHEYDKGVITKRSTCKEKGVKTYTCKVCKQTTSHAIPKDNKAHRYNKGVITKATPTRNGVITYTCMDCKDNKVQRIASPKKVTLSKTTFIYNGKLQRPTVKVSDADGKLISDSNYTVRYSKNSKDVGSYTVTISFKGNYSGVLKSSYTIVPKTTKLTSLKNTKAKTVVVKWAKVSGIHGYQIQYSTDQKFKSNVKMINVSKANKTYYVRIRTYKKDGKNTIYSTWSTSVKLKVVK